MEKDVVRKIIDAAGNNNITVTMDNMLLINTQMAGNVVSFNDDEEKIIVLRTNDNPKTMYNGPFELYVSEYEHIQNMQIQAPYASMVNAIDDLSEYIDPDAKEDMMEMLRTSPANRTYMFTPSDKDVDERAGTKPSIYRTDEYGSAGENRKDRRNPLEPTKTLSVDADGKVTE